MNKITLELLLLKRIDKMKKNMVETAFKTGMNSQQTLNCSQKLDALLNLHMKHFVFTKKNNLSRVF